MPTHLYFFLSGGPCEQVHRFENGSVSLEFRSYNPFMTHNLGVVRANLIFTTP